MKKILLVISMACLLVSCGDDDKRIRIDSHFAPFIDDGCEEVRHYTGHGWQHDDAIERFLENAKNFQVIKRCGLTTTRERVLGWCGDRYEYDLGYAGLLEQRGFYPSVDMGDLPDYMKYSSSNELVYKWKIFYYNETHYYAVWAVYDAADFDWEFGCGSACSPLP